MGRFDCIPQQLIEHFEWWLRVSGWGGVLSTYVPADAVTPACEIQVTITSFVPTSHGFCVSSSEYAAVVAEMAGCPAICHFVQFVSGDRLAITAYDAVGECIQLDGDAQLYARMGDTVWVYAYDHVDCPPPASVHIGEYPSLRICVCPCVETTGDPCA